MRKGKNTDQRQEVISRVREVRKNTGLTQEEFAELIDISLSAYKKVETGENNISIDFLRKIKQQFSVSSDYILFGEHENFDEVWKLILNTSEQNKMLLFMRLYNYFTRVKPRKYITHEEQAVYDEQFLEFFKGMDI